MKRVRSTLLLGVCVSIVLTACNGMSQDSPATDIPTAEPANESITNWAVQLIREYLDGKPWGFFGASCEQWLTSDYVVGEPTATIEDDGRVHVVFRRHPDRMLGPEEVKYYVKLDIAEVVGDHRSDTERLGTTEGCDQW